MSTSRVRTFAAAVAVGLGCLTVPAGLVGAQAVGPAEAVDDTAVALQDTTLNVPAPGVLANDQVLPPEPGLPAYTTCPGAPGTAAPASGDYRDLGPRVVTNPGVGTLTLQIDGAYTFVPAAGFVGTTTFPYSLANLDEVPACPARAGLSATLTIQVVATAAGSFDGTFTPVSAQTGPCILVDNSTIEFGDVPIGSTVWAAPTGGRTTTLSSCSPSDQTVNGTVSPALGGATGPSAVSLEPAGTATPTVGQFSYGVAARSAAAARPGAPDQLLTVAPAGVTTLQGGTGVATLEHYLIGPAAGAPVSGTGFRFAVTFVATVRS